VKADILHKKEKTKLSKPTWRGLLTLTDGAQKAIKNDKESRGGFS
jgi:hypothetical protein